MGNRPAPLERAQSASPFLDRLFVRYHQPSFIGIDPLAWPRAYPDRADREVAAFLAASLSYGNVAQINRSLGDLFKRMGRSPAAFARNFVPGKSDKNLDGFYHRFNNSRDLSALIHLIGQVLRGWNSLEGFWLSSSPPSYLYNLNLNLNLNPNLNPNLNLNPNPNLNLNPNLNPNPNLPSPLSLRAGNFMSALLRLDLADYFPNGVPREGPARPSFLYLLPSAAGTSACKRLHMFLRWAVRPDDGIDLGIWRAESPENLEYPVDTHILRIAQYLGATRRKTADARARREITTFFKLIAPDDPVRYDFSLCRLGILKHCPRRSDLTLCDRCELKPVCLNHRRLAKLART